MYYTKQLDGDVYPETKTFVVDRTNFFDDNELTFNPSEYVKLNLCGGLFLFRRVGIIRDTFGNVINWTYGAVDISCPIQILQVFNH